MDVQEDPVCGMEVDKADAVGQSEYDGQAYYFCSDVCKRRFDDDPSRYTAGRSVEILKGAGDHHAT